MADDNIGRTAGVNICEMEAAAVSRVCYLTKTPFTAIKIVSDVEPAALPGALTTVSGATAEDRGRLFEEFLGTAIERLGVACGRLVDGL